MIELKGIKYDVVKMAPRQQHHVVRRLLPILAVAGPTIAMVIDERVPKQQAFQAIAQSIGPMAGALAGIKDEDYDYVLDACLLCVNRLDGDDKWHPIYQANGRGRATAMYAQDIDAGAELRLVYAVLETNLTGFIEALTDVGGFSLSATQAAPAQPS